MEIHIYDDLDNIYYLDIFEKELSNLIKKDREYANWLDKKLKILEKGAKAATDGKRFEHLKNTELFCIRHVSKQNERVIYYIIDEDDSVILLCAFQERNKSDYRNAISAASRRLKELKKGLIV